MPWFDGGVLDVLKTGPEDPTRLIVHLPGWGDRAAAHLATLEVLADDTTTVVVAEPLMGERPRRWYDVDDDGPRLDQVRDAVAAVRELLGTLGEQHARADITLTGFSQGGALALAVAASSDGGPTPRAVASLGGYLLARDELDFARMAGLPVLVAHGVDDEMIEPLRGRAAARAMHRAEAIVQWSEVDGGHVLAGPLVTALVDWDTAIVRGEHPSAPPV